MKLYGRITVFGEYLLKENLSYCYCIKSKLFLSNSSADSGFVHPSYDQDKDGTVPFLKNAGVLHFGNIYGNLPIGYGLSSSTILSLLHLNSSQRQDLIKSIDKAMCGFSPSELDYISITMQENGVLGFGKWYPIIDFQPSYSLLIVPKERKRILTEINTDLKKSQKRQIELTKELFKILSSTGKLDFNLLFEYCKLLLSCDVYSKSARNIANDLIKKGIICKSIGGLYDKAILIIHTEESAKAECEKYIRDNYNFAQVL